jgi:hypothetical protein
MSPDRSELEEHRARVLQALSRHSDPVLREMGEQLSTGGVAPHELLSEPRYVELLQRGMRHIDEAGPDALRAPAADAGGGSVPAARR